MLIYSPNVIPVSLKEKIAVYVPCVRFRHVDQPFPMFADTPIVDTRFHPPQIAYERSYARKSLLVVRYALKKYERIRRGSGYTDDYLETRMLDGVDILLYLGREGSLVQKTDFPTGEEQYGTLSGRVWHESHIKHGDLRTDLHHPRVQAFVMNMLEDHWQHVLQLPLS